MHTTASPTPNAPPPDAVRRKPRALAIAAILLFAVVSLAYFSVRAPLFNVNAPILASAMLAAELFGLATLALHLFSVATLLDRRPPPPPAAPKADIFVTTWNEPLAILRTTLIAAKKVRLARQVWLLDDGDRAEMKALADELGVRYLARKERAHAKAGNLNNALAHSDAEFIAQFDCDHAPKADFLERTLGYFRDPALAFVQTPQDFYNIDSFQHRRNEAASEYWHEQTLFYRVIQPGKDNWDAAFFCGSCAVIRTKALADIGGFAVGTITEDIHTSLRLHRRGWRSAYHNESLAFGLAPANFDQYETQRLRWGRGAMQVWRKEGLLFRSGLTLPQKFCYLASVVTYFEGWQKAVLYFLPMVVLTTGAVPITWTDNAVLWLFALWILSGMLANETLGRGYTKTLWMEEYNCLRYFTFMNATLTLVFPVDWRFNVTPKNLDAVIRLPLRLLPQAAIVATALIAIAIGAFRYFTEAHLPPGAFVANATWAAVNAVIAARAIEFATRKYAQRRTDHRFRIPTPVIIESTDPELAVIAEDISVGGLRLLAGDGSHLPEEIAGRILLPNGPLAFRASRTAAASTGEHNYAFDWPTPAAADPLKACLFGNTLQWDLNRWRETGPDDFSLRRFARELVKRESPPDPWRLCRLAGAGRSPVPCLAREDKPHRVWRILAYEPPPAVQNLSLRDRNGPLGHFEIDGAQGFDVGGGALFMITLRRAARAAPPTAQGREIAA
jgi:cellulose synthase (UDP-forming)